MTKFSHSINLPKQGNGSAVQKPAGQSSDKSDNREVDTVVPPARSGLRFAVPMPPGPKVPSSTQ